MKLVDLLEEDCINEEQLKVIITRLKERDREVIWTTENEIVLKSLSDKSKCYLKLHKDCANYYSRLHTKFTMPMFIIILLSSFCMFLSGYTDFKEYLGIIAGSINLLVATLQKIMEFIQPERFKIEHQSASKNFDQLSGTIQVQLTLSRQEREPMPMFLINCFTEFTILVQNSPDIKNSILRTFAKEYANSKFATPDEVGKVRETKVHETIYVKTEKVERKNSDSNADDDIIEEVE